MGRPDDNMPGAGLTTGGRLANTKEAARRLGLLDDAGNPKPSIFLRLSREPGFPRPVYGRNWWDMKAISFWLNKRSGLTIDNLESDQAYWDQLLLERLKKK